MNNGTLEGRVAEARSALYANEIRYRAEKTRCFKMIKDASRDASQDASQDAPLTDDEFYEKYGKTKGE